MLLLITATTLVAVALLSVRERIRDYGVLKAIGLTPRQITSTVVSAHAALAVLASLLAVPLGIGLYLALFRIAGDTTEDAVIAPWWSLALIPIGTVLVVVAATSLPARLATRIHTADALRYEPEEGVRHVFLEVGPTTVLHPFRILDGQALPSAPRDDVPAWPPRPLRLQGRVRGGVSRDSPADRVGRCGRRRRSGHADDVDHGLARSRWLLRRGHLAQAGPAGLGDAPRAEWQTVELS